MNRKVKASLLLILICIVSFPLGGLSQESLTWETEYGDFMEDFVVIKEDGSIISSDNITIIPEKDYKINKSVPLDVVALYNAIRATAYIELNMPYKELVKRLKNEKINFVVTSDSYVVEGVENTAVDLVRLIFSEYIQIHLYSHTYKYDVADVVYIELKKITFTNKTHEDILLGNISQAALVCSVPLESDLIITKTAPVIIE